MADYFERYSIPQRYTSGVRGIQRRKMRMTDKIVYMAGPVRWAKVFDHNRDTGEYAPEGGQYTIDIGLDAEDTKEVKGWNRLYTGKKDAETGLTYFQFKRKHTAFKNDGELIEAWSGPPALLMEGEGLIGNGSVCTVKLAVNKVGPKTFVRLEGVRVDTLVPYEGGGGPVEVDNRSGELPF